MKLKITLLLFLIIASFQLFAQQKLSPKTTVSVVTCGPGSELYSAFGHSAFRVFDPLTGFDKIYNYGTFDFNAPNFYLNFLKGNLIYQLSTSNFDRFLRIYKYEKRWVKTQVLNLSPAEVQEIYGFLENNAKPENKNYRYDFFYDNCSTKIEEVVKTVLKDKVTFTNNHITTKKSQRDLIDDYTQNFAWAKFGIDLALGSVIDGEATKDEYKFLPDYIFKSFEQATITINSKAEPLVVQEFTILKAQPIKKQSFITSPLSVFSIISLFILFITYKNYKQQKRTKFIDFIIYFFTGIIGVVVLLLWFATAHTATFENLNFLWAFAPNLLVAFILLKDKLPKWLPAYQKILLVLLATMIVVWIVKIQVFNSALLPFVVVLATRYVFLNWFQKKQLNS